MRAVPITEREQVAPAHHAAFDEVMATYNGRVVGPLRILFYVPELARRISNIGASMRNSSPFPAARELAIIAAAREWDCLYEWYAHEPGARRTGVSDAAIDVVRHRRPVEGLPAEEADVINFVRSLLREHRVPHAYYDSMVARLGVAGLVEMTATVGFYQVFACVMNTFEVPADADIDMPVVPNDSSLVDPWGETVAYGGAPRIEAPAEPGEAETREFAAEARRRWGDGETAILDVLLHVSRVARDTAIAREYIETRLALPAAVRDLAMLTAARVAATPHLHGERSEAARESGVSAGGIALALGHESESATDAEKQLVAFTRTLLRRNRVPQEQFDQMQSWLGRDGLVELTAAIGFASLLACVANAFEINA